MVVMQGKTEEQPKKTNQQPTPADTRQPYTCTGQPTPDNQQQAITPTDTTIIDIRQPTDNKKQKIYKHKKTKLEAKQK
jgi:hypothetical protein